MQTFFGRDVMITFSMPGDIGFIRIDRLVRQPEADPLETREQIREMQRPTFTKFYSRPSFIDWRHDGFRDAAGAALGLLWLWMEKFGRKRRIE
jgi:hypothetical protein